MTLKYMQGFETCRDDSDLRAQGWTGVSPLRTGYIPAANTGLAGTALHTIGPGVASAAAPGASGATDPGYYNTGVTVNQAWTAGGFTLGAFARLNSTIPLSYSGTSVNSANPNCNGITFDGTLYWAMQFNSSSSTYNVATSPNLVTWTVTPSQPTSIGPHSQLFYLGGGIVGFFSGSGSTAVFYTSNGGTSWSTNALGVGTLGVGVATGNSSFPHAVLTQPGATTGTCSVFVGTVSGTMTSVTTGTPTGAYACLRPYLVGGLIMLGANGNLFTATASNSALNTSAAWSKANLPASANSIAYNPTSNLWVVAHVAGISTTPNTGAAGTPVAPTGTVTYTSRYSTVGMQNIFWTGSQMIAVGFSGHIVTSPDGLVWTEAGAHILPVGTANTNWNACINDGTRYVLCSDSGTGVIATTPDLLTNYAAQYIQDSAKSTASNNYGIFGIYSGTAPSSAGAWTANNNYFGYNANTPSGGTCQITMSSFSTNYTAFTVPVNLTFGHYYELVATPTSGTANSFNFSLYVDGVLTQTYSAIPMASSTTDTTSLLIIVLSRRNDFVGYDDMYFTVQDGTGVVGPLGPVNIITSPPTTDVSDQWVKTGSAASNSLSVNQPAFSSQSANYVSSANAGDKDVYSSANTLPAGYTVKAVQVEAYFTKTSTSAPTANVGIVSGGSESDSANVTASGTSAVYVSQIANLNPNGNAVWNNAAAIAAEIALNHVA
jgi:hypothetical protein